MNLILLSELIKNHSKKTISLDEISNLISMLDHIPIDDLKNKEYLFLVKTIDDLLKNGVIRPRGKVSNKRNPSLFTNYNILKEEVLLTEEDKILLLSMHKINTSYYESRPKEFLEDKEILVTINNFLKDYKSGIMSVNERSYELFKDEKAIKNPKTKTQVSTVLSRIKMKETDLMCYENDYPLLSYVYPNFYNKSKRNILVIENLDTYWSVHKALRESNHNIDLLVFGQGYSVVKNFKSIMLYNITPNDEISYFGDIDLSGIDILISFIKNYENLKIIPNKSLYKLSLKIGIEKGIEKSKSEDQVMLDEKDLNLFLHYFDIKERDKMRNILVNRYYIPQESINYEVLKENIERMGLFE